MTDPLAVRRERAILVAAFAAVCALVATLAVPQLEVPGLYYDEVIQAEPALQFLSERGNPVHIPGARSVLVFGRWLPLMTQPYMGALKSQLLIPWFALVEPTAASLRLATLAWGLCGLLLVMIFAHRLLGLPAALVAGALLAFDPSFLFVARHDWGSFALSFACRGGGLLLLHSGWTRSSGGRLFAGGVCLGLGLYNKIDFGIFVLAAALALILAAPAIAVAALRDWRGRLLPASAGVAIGGLPLWIALGPALAATRMVSREQRAGATDWSEKLSALATTLDGSYFQRLMLAGGDFDAMAAVEGAATGPFLVLFALCSVGLAWRSLAGRRTGGAPRTHTFVWLTASLALLGILLTPRAERIHHVLNAAPFPHLVVAVALVELWRSGAWRRVAAAVALAATLGGSAAVDASTLATLRETGGRGRWSDALARFADELERDPEAVAVSLDWGFHGPLRYRARELRAVEPIWTLARAPHAGVPWSLEGTPHTVYLVFPEEFAVFDYGLQFLEAIGRLPGNTVAVRRHQDRSGGLAFLSVRFARPHRLSYRGDFEVRLD